MKIFNIQVSGKTLTEIINGIDEAKKRIEAGNTMGFDSNDEGDFSFESKGMYEENDSEY